MNIFGYPFKTKQEAAKAAQTWQQTIGLPISELKKVIIIPSEYFREDASEWYCSYNGEPDDWEYYDAFSVLYLDPYSNEDFSTISMSGDCHHMLLSLKCGDMDLWNSTSRKLNALHKDVRNIQEMMEKKKKAKEKS